MNIKNFTLALVAVAVVMIVAVVAFAQGVDPALVSPAEAPDLITTLVQSLGLGQTATLVIVVVLAALRAVAATISAHVPDEKLGVAASLVNLLGGNTKHAANETPAP